MNIKLKNITWKLNYSHEKEYEGEITKVVVQVYEMMITLGEVADIDYKI